MTDTPAAPSSEELAALIEADIQRRVQQARAEIRAVCERWRVKLIGTMKVEGDRVETGVMVVPE